MAADTALPARRAYHKGFDIETTKHVTDMDPSKISTTLSEAAKTKIISTRIRVAQRSLTGILVPHKHL